MSAQARVRDRHGTLPELRRRTEDHCRRPGGVGPRAPRAAGAGAATLSCPCADIASDLIQPDARPQFRRPSTMTCRAGGSRTASGVFQPAFASAIARVNRRTTRDNRRLPTGSMPRLRPRCRHQLTSSACRPPWRSRLNRICAMSTKCAKPSIQRAAGYSRFWPGALVRCVRRKRPLENQALAAKVSSRAWLRTHAVGHYAYISMTAMSGPSPQSANVEPIKPEAAQIARPRLALPGDAFRGRPALLAACQSWSATLPCQTQQASALQVA